MAYSGSRNSLNTTFSDIGASLMNMTATSLMNQQSVFGYNKDGTRKVNPFGATNVYLKH